MPVDRAAIRDAAKYLRSVRPIDPAEIREYVSDRPDARVVRQVLRESAIDLGLVERADGTFVPVSAGSIQPSFEGVTALPDRYGNVIEERLVDRFGPDWATGESGDRLREVVRGFKADYHAGRSVEYDETVALGYAIYHLPAYYAATQYVFWDLVRDGLLDRSPRVLDVGAGVGGPAMGLIDLLGADDDPALIEYHAVEPSDAVSILRPLLETTGPNVHWQIHRSRAKDVDPAGPYDVILFSNVVSELSDPVAVVDEYRSHLAPDGSLVAVAPADRETSLSLRSVERAVEQRGATVYAPMVRLFPDVVPTVDVWSFDERQPIDLPDVQRRLGAPAERPEEFHHTAVRYSYSILREDDARRYDVDASTRPVVPLGETTDHVTERRDVVVAKLSRDLADDGHPVFTVSDGSERERHFAVLVNETELNRRLVSAEYGDLLAVEGALVLWNEDEEAVNLVIDEETVVDPV
ncbi:MAG: small ribosomal subunit Rsm22 family protein [Halanaeroarchaeum sp.]